MAKKTKKDKYPVILVESPKKKKGETEFEFRLRVLKETYGPLEYDFGTDFEE